MASSSSAASWYPPAQRVQAKVGKALNKAIKARKLKGEPAPAPPTNKRIPDFHYHSFLFKHKPISIDHTRPATLEVRKSPDNGVFAKAEFPSVNPGDAYAMVGEETPAKEVDCLLIYDEVTNTWTLEKLDSFIRFQRVTKVAATSPRPASPGTPSLKKPKPADDRLDDDLERQLLDLAGSSIAEEKSRKPPPPPPPASAGSIKRPADSDDEEGEIEVPLRLLHQPAKDVRNVKPVPKTSPKAKASAAAPSPKPPIPKPAAPVPTPQLSSSSSNASKPSKPPVKTSAPAPSSSLPPKPTPSTASAEPLSLPLKSKKARPPAAARLPTVEEAPPAPLPQKLAKRPRVAPPPQPTPPPPPPKPLDLSLPGGSGTFAPPPIPASFAKPAPPKVAPPPPPPDLEDPASMIIDSDEGEDEWEPVAEVAPEPAPEPQRVFNIVMEEENDPVVPDARGASMEYDEDPDLDAALHEELFSMDVGGDGNDMDYGSDGEEPEDFLAIAMSNEPMGPIMSLNRYVGQNVGQNDDSDVTSSSSEEDSDDE
ncbi:hypothetical protein BJ165DRAFT_1520732 [Panaeolus papilionaceus]|nr:hypothetical protein BJ165DRAFT_1520732 [Panaeolus papilionaceus]